MENKEAYLAKLRELVGKTMGRRFEVDEDMGSGGWFLTFPGHLIPVALTVYASPLYECDEGIPVEIYNDQAEVEEHMQLAFRPTGDMEVDALQYVHVCNLIPDLLAVFLTRRGLG